MEYLDGSKVVDPYIYNEDAGKKSIRIAAARYEPGVFNISFFRNGFQTTIVEADREMMDMLRRVIDQWSIDHAD